MRDTTISAITNRAQEFVGTLNNTELAEIVRGNYPVSFADFSVKRINVYARAALIVLDIQANDYLDTSEKWSKEILELRIAMVRSRRTDSTPSSVDDITRRREIASGVKLDPSWQTTPIRLQRFGRHS